MTLTLLRHAHTTWNGPPKRYQGRHDIKLSDKGILNSKEFSKIIKLPDRIVSSPALRCRQTIQYILNGKTVPIHYDERLWEIDNGFFSGLLQSEAAEKYPNMHASWLKYPETIRPGDGESLREMQQRVISSIKDIINSNKNHNTLIVTHGGPMRIVMLSIQNKSLNDFHKVSVSNLKCLTLSKKHVTSLLNLKF